MGCNSSKSMTTGDDDANSISKSIEKQLEADRQAQNKTIKILLLGTGESGKSTVLKQMRLKYHERAYSMGDRLDYVPVILSNLVLSMNVVIEAMEQLNLPFTTPEESRWAAMIAELPQLLDHLSPAHFMALEGLWASANVKTCVMRSAEYQLNDSAAFFFDNIHRYSVGDFVPTNEDILRSRVKTTGISETSFHVGDRIYRVMDVGGQRSERRKWVSCFEGVNVLLFLIAVSELDQRLYEDSQVKRFEEAQSLFGQIANSAWFKNSQIILFLNKIDILAQKLPTIDLREHLPDYRGPRSLQHVLAYLGQSMLEQNHSSKRIYVHNTCCTDTAGINVILNAVQDQIAQNLIASAYLM